MFAHRCSVPTRAHPELLHGRWMPWHCRQDNQLDIRYWMAAQALLMTHPGNNRIKFCSSLSSTSNVKYWKLSGNRGLTEKASLASRMQTLDWVKRWWFRAWGILLKSMKSVHMWVILRLCSLSNSFEAWKGPRRRPGRISWHSRLISYLHRPWMNSVSVNVV